MSIAHPRSMFAFTNPSTLQPDLAYSRFLPNSNCPRGPGNQWCVDHHGHILHHSGAAVYLGPETYHRDSHRWLRSPWCSPDTIQAYGRASFRSPCRHHLFPRKEIPLLHLVVLRKSLVYYEVSTDGPAGNLGVSNGAWQSVSHILT